MDMMNPSEMVPRLDMVFLELAAAGIDFRRLSQDFWNIGGIYRAKRQCGRRSRWAQPTRVRLGPRACPGGLCSLRWPPAPPLCSINTPNILETLGESMTINSSHRKFQNTRSNLHTISEGFIMSIGASAVMRE